MVADLSGNQHFGEAVAGSQIAVVIPGSVCSNMTSNLFP